MFESIGRSIELFRISWAILVEDRKLLVFPLLSGVVSLIILATFILPLILAQFLRAAIPFGAFFFYGALFAFYLASYFVVIFFNTALVSCVNARLQGREMTVREGLSNALQHFPSILGWALISATVGIILHAIRERSGIIGQIATAIVGGAWGLVTFFVVPVLVLEHKGVFDAIRGSASLIRKTWGESIVGSASIMLVFTIIGVLGVLGVFASLFVGNGSVVVFGIALVLFLVLVIVLAIVGSAMQGIFVTALYTYAKTGIVPSAFNRDLIQNAFVQK
jgi:ABC-type multidrug transport system fused ATPase/permease subunit